MGSTPTPVLRFDMLPRQISNYVNKQNSLIGINGMAEPQERKRPVKLVHYQAEETIDIHSQEGKIQVGEENSENV
jgi:hypothetical protein